MRKIKIGMNTLRIVAIVTLVTVSLMGASFVGIFHNAIAISTERQPAELQMMEVPAKISGYKAFTVIQETEMLQPALFGTDVQVSLDPDNDLNPAMIASGESNILTAYETEIGSSDSQITMQYSTTSGATWSDLYTFDLPGYNDQPRLDFYEGNSAYGTFLADPWEELSVSYYLVIPDVTDPDAGEGWIAYYVSWADDEGVPFTSADVACYAMEPPSKSGFWGIVGFTGDNEYPGWEEDNTFMMHYPGDEHTIIFWRSSGRDVFNVSADIDQSTGRVYMVADYIYETNPDDTGAYLMTTTITDDVDWWQGSWRSKTFKHCAHPEVEAQNGRVFVTAEIETDDGSTDIVCYTTTTPEYVGSWETYMVTETPGVDEEYPALSVTSDKDAAVVFTRDNNLFVSGSMDAAQTWTSAEQVNDVDGTVVGHYGCADVAAGYTMWTDSRGENTEIYFDETGITFPLITIQELSGGLLGVSMTVENIGTGDATDIPWSIVIEGNFVLLGNHTEGVIPSLAAGDSVTVKSDIVFGLGPARITGVAGGERETTDATILLILVVI